MQLNKVQTTCLFLLSLMIVAFGQPAWSQALSFLTSIVGFAIFFRVLISFEKPSQRFWLATAWFAGVQWVQLSWFLSHPYLYIVAVHILVSLIFGMQFGLLGLLAIPQKITKISRIFLITGSWVLLEWSRLFILSGFAFNPIGLSLSANIYTLQAASLAGVFGMSFWVLFVNLLALKAWLEWPRFVSSCSWGLCASLPFLWGVAQFKIHHSTRVSESFQAVLIQPVFPIEESLKFRDSASFIKFVQDEWKQILTLSKEHEGKEVHLIALPEFIVPFATYTPVFKYEDVKQTFVSIFGEKVQSDLPEPQEPLASQVKTPHGLIWMVSNAYWLQALANILHAPVVAGMEDIEDSIDGRREYFSSAQYAQPMKDHSWPGFQRYDKRILVPMGEYIPFSFCRKLAASYGITGSFVPGQEAKIFDAKVPIGTCICFEETFGHIMRENRLKGAEILVNLTSDAWYPTLAQQHCDHARLRTVENGIPLIRSCNTGITCGFDSLGREIKVLGDNSQEKIYKPGSLYLSVPLHSYSTLYSFWGDYFILAISSLCLLSFLYKK